MLALLVKIGQIYFGFAAGMPIALLNVLVFLHIGHFCQKEKQHEDNR